MARKIRAAERMEVIAVGYDKAIAPQLGASSRACRSCATVKAKWWLPRSGSDLTLQASTGFFKPGYNLKVPVSPAILDHSSGGVVWDMSLHGPTQVWESVSSMPDGQRGKPAPAHAV